MKSQSPDRTPLTPAHQGIPFDFECVRRIGFGARHLRRLESFRLKHEKRGSDVFVIVWPGGVWCVLALRCAPLAPALTSSQVVELYAEARAMIRDGYLPKLIQRYDPNATH